MHSFVNSPKNCVQCNFTEKLIDVVAITILMGITAFVVIRANMAITCITGIITVTAIILILVIITIVSYKANVIKKGQQPKKVITAFKDIILL